MAQRQQQQTLLCRRDRFKLLRDIWLEETKYLSSATMIVQHRAYQDIIDMGPKVLPYIIEDIRLNDTMHWYHAINEITGDCPEIPDYARGRLKLINQLYIAWYQDREEKRKRLWEAVRRIERERRGRPK